jgi:hypothetical protein
MKGRFVSDDFSVPPVLETQEFRLRMLTVNDVVKDYDAVMSSMQHLQGVFGPQSNWPTPELSLEQDLIDLGWHQKEFQKRSSFAYTVMSLDEKKCLGCVYFYPSTVDHKDADVYLWARQSEIAGGLEKRLFLAVKNWIADEWPFRAVAYPGRDESTGSRT